MNNAIIVKQYCSPCGKLILGEYKNNLCLCDWIKRKDRANIDRRIKNFLRTDYMEGQSTLLSQTSMLLDQYFSGDPMNFNLPLLLIGTTFQKEVWKHLLNIPYGKTVSYLEIAHSLQRPKAVRAVANAIGANAMSIIIPCHRVVAASGDLSGYAGGVKAKEFLINLESHHPSFSRQV